MKGMEPSKENDFIADEIRKSGFPLEIEVAEFLQDKGWHVFPSHYYPDRDEDTHKELDILAEKIFSTKQQQSGKYSYTIMITLLIECKKREDLALVFFPRQRRSEDEHGRDFIEMDPFKVVKYSSYLASRPSSLRSPEIMRMKLNPLNKTLVPLDVAKQLTGIRQILKFRDFTVTSSPEKSVAFDVVKLKKTEIKFDRKSEHNEIYWALTGLTKAAQEMAWSMVEVYEDFSRNADISLDILLFFPALVLDGKLKTWRTGKVTDANEVLFEFSPRSSYYDEPTFISVLTKERFRPWLEQLEFDTANAVNRIGQDSSILDNQVDLIFANRIHEK
jgi:hypothetical protein